MNKYRRGDIGEAVRLIERAKEIIERVKDEEEDAFDNLPESLQGSARGESMEDNVDLLGDAYDDLDDIVYRLVSDIC